MPCITFHIQLKESIPYSQWHITHIPKRFYQFPNYYLDKIMNTFCKPQNVHNILENIIFNGGSTTHEFDVQEFVKTLIVYPIFTSRCVH